MLGLPRRAAKLAVSAVLVLATPVAWAWAPPVGRMRRGMLHRTWSLQPTAEGEQFLADLVGTPAAELDAAVDTAFDQIGQAEMRAIIERAEDGNEWATVLTAVEAARHSRMETAKGKIESLLEAGEINKLDKQLVKMVQGGEVDPAFILVLNGNIEAAKADEGSGKLSILTHISTRVQEELEKKQDPGVGVLHKLMRTEDAALRGRILRHYLCPQTTVGLPDGSSITLDAPKDALVPPLDFSAAVDGLVKQLRGMDIDGELVVGLIEQVRQLAKEARGVVAESYPEPLLDEFTEALTPTFQGAVPPPPSEED